MSDRDIDLGVDDARFALAGIAAASERRNRPRWMFAIGLVALLACGGWMMLQMMGVSSAKAALGERRAELVDVKDVSTRLAAIRNSASDPDNQRSGQPITNILQRINRAGEQSGIDLPIARESVDESAGAIERQYHYNVSDDSLPALIGWVESATSTVPGLEVNRIQLSPQGDRAWQLDITFVRYERAS